MSRWKWLDGCAVIRVENKGDKCENTQLEQIWEKTQRTNPQSPLRKIQTGHFWPNPQSPSNRSWYLPFHQISNNTLLLPETLVSSAICKLIFLKLENQFWLQCIFENRLTVPRKVWTPHARLVWWTDKYRGKNLCIHLHSVDAYSYLRIDLNTCFVCLHLTGRKSFNELGGGTFDLSQTFYARFYVCFSIWPAKDLK